MSECAHRRGHSHRPALRARLQFSRLLEAPEDQVAEKASALENDPLFERLADAGVIAVVRNAWSRSARRTFEGRQLRATSAAGELALDGNAAEVALIERIGREAFEQAFLGAEAMSDSERAALCGISVAQAGALRQFIDRLYLRDELSGGQAEAAASATLSPVAGISLENGLPALAFFHCSLWKSRYRIDRDRQAAVLAALNPAAAAEARSLLRELEQVERRKTTLLRVLEEILIAQARYFRTREPKDRRPLTQHDLARKLELDASVICRLVADKAVALPWGVEVPLSALLPNRKTILRDHVYDLAREHPELSDQALAEVIFQRFSVRVSRQSVMVYRHELAGLRGSSSTNRREARKHALRPV